MRILPALLLMGVWLSPAVAASKSQIIHYPVKGDTAAEIYQSIKTAAPRIAPNATFAFTAPFFKTDKRERQAGKQCRYTAFRTSTIFHIALPQLSSKRKPPPLLRKQWNAFVSYLLEHEQWHRDNWTACLKDYDARALALEAADCGALDRKREKLFTSIKMACVKRDEGFDVAFRKEVLKHPFIKAAQKQD